MNKRNRKKERDMNGITPQMPSARRCWTEIKSGCRDKLVRRPGY